MFIKKGTAPFLNRDSPLITKIRGLSPFK